MKRIPFFLAVLSALLVMSVSCSNHKTFVEDQDAPTMLCGGYTHYRGLSDEESELFAKIYQGSPKLTPYKVATQVVAGTNYSFLCHDKAGDTYRVVIYQRLPGQGEPEVTSVEKQQ